MSDFRAHIVGDLDLSEARSQMESFLNEYKDKKLKITPEINTSQAQKAGEQAAQAVSKGMEKSAQSTGAQFAQAVSKGASKSKKGKDLFGFSEEQQKVRKKIAKDAELLQESYPGLNKKDAKKDARGYYTVQEYERKKAEQAAKKASEQKMKDSISAINEESKTRERAEKQNYQARKKYADAIMKESLANIEKQSKNKADIIKAQASGKDSTVDVLKEQRKLLRSEGRKLQKEMRSYNDIYSPSERSQILRNKRMESSYDVDMARAAVSDKVAASLKVSSSGSASSSNSTKSGNNKIRYNVETGNYAARSSKMEKQLSVYSGQDTENVAKATTALKTYNEELGNLQNHFNGSKRMNGSELAASFERMTKAGDTFKNTLSQINDTQSKNLATGVAERGANKIAAYYEANSKAVKKYGASLKELEHQYRNAKTVEDKGNIENEFSTLKSRISAEGLTGKSGLDDAKRAFRQIGQFAMTYGLIQNTVMQIPSQMISAVKDVNAAQIELTKVSNAPQSQLSQYWNEAADSAQKYGSTISDVISSTADWSRLGYNLDDAKKLSDVTTLLQKVGDNMTQESSSQGLISTLKGFKMEADEASKVVDVVNEVANTEPIDTAGIFDGLTRSASSMKAANNTFEETVALITAANSVVQDPDSVGTAFKTISMRIRGADTELQQAGLDTEGMAESTAKLRQEVMALSGVDIMKNENEFKSTYDVLDELSTKWADLTDIQQASLTELIAGKRQGNIVSSLMTNFDVARKSLQTALNDADGSGERELESWNKGIEASISHFQAAMQNLATSTISSDFFKGLTDTGTGALNVLTNIVDKFGLLNTAAVGLGIFQGKNNSGISNLISGKLAKKQSTKEMTSVIEAIDRNYNSGNRSQKASDIFDEVGASKTTRDAYIKDTQDYLDSLNKYPVGYKRAKEGLDAYNESQGKAGKELIKSTSLMQDFGSGLANVGKTALSIAGDVGFNVLISAGLTAAGKAWDNYSNKQENAIEKGNEALSNYKQTNSTMQEATSWIKDNAERYTELSKGATSLGEQGTLTDAEFKEYNELSAQMATYLPSQIKGYNSLGTAILSVGDSTKQVNNALQSEKLTQYGEAMESAQNVIDKFKAEMYQDAGITKEIGLTNQQNAIKNFLADYDSGKIKDVFGSENMVKGIDQSAYLNNYNLKDSFKAAGIKGSGLFGGYTKADFINKDNIATLRNYQQQLETEVQTSVDAVKDIMPAFLQSNKDYLKLTSEDNKPEIDSMMTTLISSLDKSGVETISGGNLGELSSDEVEANIRNWSSNLVKDLQKKDTQDALTSLFALDDKKTKMSFDEYEKQADDAVKKVRKQTDAFTDEQLRNSSGIHDTLDQLQTDVDNITSKFSGDKGFSEDKLKYDYTSSQLDALSSIATDKTFTGNWKAALDQMNSVEREAQLSADKMQKIVTTASSNLSTMQTAISESMSNTGLTADSISNIKSDLQSVVDSSDELKDFDLNSLFTNTAKGVKLNNDKLEDMLELQHNLRSKDFADSIDQQTESLKEQTKETEELKKQYGETSDEYISALEKQKQAQEDLNATQQARSQYHAQYQQQKQLLSEYAQWQRSQSTENAGDKYNNLFSGLKAAKDAYDKGLVGTDDFKTYAKMLSPSGSTDPENFAENYGKAARYITEDESGLVHFFEDLSHKTDEAGNQMAKFNDQTQQWELNVHDLGEVAQKLGTGETVVEALFGRAEDYGATSTVISDQEDGILKTTEAIQNKAEAQARLNQMEEANKQAQADGKDDIYNTTAIEAARQEVEKYQAQIDGLKESMEYLSEHSGVDNQTKEAKTATDEIKQMKQEYDSLMEEANGNTESTAYKTAQQLKDSIQQKANDSNLELDAELNVTGVKASAQEGLQKAQESGQISSDINLDYDKSSMSLDQLNSKIQELNNEKVRIQTEADTSGSEETLNQLDTEISALQNQKVQVEIDTALNNGNTVDELIAMSDEKLMTTVGCDASEVETVRSELQSMQGEAINMSVKMDSTQFASLINAITGETIEVPVEANTDGAVQETTSAIEGVNPKVTPEVDTSNVESQTQSAVQNATQGAKVELPSVDVKGNVTEVTGTPSGTVDVKGKVTSVTGKPSGTVEVKGKLVGNISGTSTKKASVTFSAKHGDVDTYKPKNKNAKVIFGKDSRIPDDYKPDDKSAKVNYTLGSTPSYNPPNIERTVTYTIKTVGSAPSGGSTTHSSSGGKMGGSSGTFASGTITSLGHARAFASGSLTDFSPAFAKGNVSIPHDQQALVNEVSINGHSESIVRDGVWSMIPGGAHLANLKKGDIIFSASQTEALLKNGSIPGHARAYASGTVDDVGDIDLSHAYAVGGLSLKFSGGLKSHKYGNSGGGSTNTTPTSSGGSSRSGSGNGGGGGGNNSSTTSKQKHAEQVFDWVARTLTKFKDTVENISNRINDYVSSAFKKTMLNRQEKAIVEEINANKHGAQSYTNKANSIASGYTYYYTPEGSDTEQKMNIVIPDSYKKAVQGGYWNIEDMDTTTDFGKGLAEAIQKYQDYYDKAKDCTQEAQNLYNEQLKVFEQWANMPTEDAGKKIDTLTNKVNGLKSAISSLSTGKSGLASIARQIKVDNPNITKAEQKLNSAKKTQSNAQKKLTSARKARGNAVKVATQSTIKVDSDSSNLKSVLNKSNASSARKTQIRKAINSGQTINTKGLKGTTLKAAKQYNSAVKKNAKDMDKVSRTEYQVTSAQRHLSIANKNVKTQQTNLTNAKKNLTATQRAILSKQKSKKTFVVQNALLDYQTSASKQENAYRQSALKAAQKNMQTYKNNVANRNKSKKALLATKGKITTAQRNAIKKNQKVDTSNIKDPKLKKQLEAYNKYVTGSNPDKGRILSNALSTAQSNADQAQAEYAAMRVTNEQEKFKNVQNYYSGWNDRYSNYTEQHQKKYEKSEAHGNYTNSKKYDTQINDLQKQRKYKQNEVTDLQKQLNASVKSGIIKKGSEEWLEMTNQILEAQNAVSDFDTQIEQAKQDKITTVYEEMFDRAIEKANRLKDKISSINDLITEDMMIDKDTGNLTEMGALSITMNSQQLDTELNNLQTYVKKRQQIIDDFANGSNKSKYGEKTYDELMAENDSAMQESLKNANSYRQSIISIVTNQAKAIQDAMFKEIDARKKALKKKKEYYDYDKTIKKKTDEIELIKQQIRGLEGLTDAESKAQKARLEASLKDKQDDLDDTVRDHVYDITVNGLDDLETQLSEDFEKWSNQLSSDLAKMSDAISNAISGAGENYSDMMAGIDYILNNIGGITSGQYFTNQDKSNMKKSNSFDTGYNSGHLKGYANGTKHVGSNRIAMTNENGREIIVTKDGWITPLEASDMVIPNDITETLIDMAERQQNYAMNSNFKMPELKVKDASGNSVNNVYNTFTVQGDLTRDTLPELNKILDLASSKTQNDIRKNKRRFG